MLSACNFALNRNLQFVWENSSFWFVPWGTRITPWGADQPSGGIVDRFAVVAETERGRNEVDPGRLHGSDPEERLHRVGRQVRHPHRFPPGMVTIKFWSEFPTFNQWLESRLVRFLAQDFLDAANEGLFEQTCWYGPSWCRSQKLPRNQVVVTWKN